MVTLPVVHVDEPGSLARAIAKEVVRWRPVEGKFIPRRALFCPLCSSRQFLLPPDDLPLRDYLQRRDSAGFLLDAVLAGVLAEALPIRFQVHLGRVYARVEAIAEPHQWPLKLVALVHEERPAKTFDILEAGGMPDQAPFVAEILVSFASLWHLEGETAVREWVRLHRQHLEPLLLFEVAHEGRASEQVRDIARRTGLEGRVEDWERTLARRFPDRVGR